MDVSAIDALAQQLQDLLLKQLSVPDGTKNNVGFFGSGVAVDSSSFLSDGQFNPARINQWLEIVVDPLGGVILDGNIVDFIPMTATQLAEAIYGQAMCLAPPDTDDYQAFARAKSAAMQNLGGATTVKTAPLDWYDQARIAAWASCTLNASSSSTTTTETGSGSGTGKDTTTTPPIIDLPPKRPPIWAWRKLRDVSTVDVAERIDLSELPIQTKLRLNQRPPGVKFQPLMATSLKAARIADGPEVASPGLRVARTAEIAQTAQAATVSVAHVVPSLLVAQAPSSVQSLAASQIIADAAKQATTSTVSTKTLSLTLKYQVVSLSRVPWWNEFFLLLNNWYIPGLQRASVIEESSGHKSLGIPIAMVLTSDVGVTSTWTDADRAAATSSTHFGPWALTSANFSSTTNAVEATLMIPGVQAIACIYRELPAIPPQSDPSIAVPKAS
jgi:hypothetical protein